MKNKIIISFLIFSSFNFCVSSDDSYFHLQSKLSEEQRKQKKFLILVNQQKEKFDEQLNKMISLRKMAEINEKKDLIKEIEEQINKIVEIAGKELGFKDRFYFVENNARSEYRKMIQYFNHKEYDFALDKTYKLFLCFPNFSKNDDVLLCRAESFYALKLYSLAEQEYRKILSLYPNYKYCVDIYAILINIKYKNREYYEVLNLYEELTKKFPNVKCWNETDYIISLCYYHLKELNYLKKSAKRFERDSLYYGFTQYLISLLFIEQKKVEEAIPPLEDIIKNVAKTFDAEQLFKSTHLKLGHLYYELGNYKKAFDNYYHISSKDKLYDEACWGIAWLFIKTKDYNTAITTLDEIISLKGSKFYIQAKLLLAYCYTRIENYDKAKFLYQEVLNIFKERMSQEIKLFSSLPLLEKIDKEKFDANTKTLLNDLIKLKRNIEELNDYFLYLRSKNNFPKALKQEQEKIKKIIKSFETIENLIRKKDIEKLNIELVEMKNKMNDLEKNIVKIGIKTEIPLLTQVEIDIELLKQVKEEQLYFSNNLDFFLKAAEIADKNEQKEEYIKLKTKIVFFQQTIQKLKQEEEKLEKAIASEKKILGKYLQETECSLATIMFIEGNKYRDEIISLNKERLNKIEKLKEIEK